jgi:hypothetical protein
LHGLFLSLAVAGASCPNFSPKRTGDCGRRAAASEKPCLKSLGLKFN